MKWLNNIGRIIKKKDGGYFMVFERRKDKDQKYIGENPFPLIVNEGDFFQLKPKKDDLKGLIEQGKITEETANKICETVRFEISRAPQKDGESKGTADAPAKSKKDEVNF